MDKTVGVIFLLAGPVLLIPAAATVFLKVLAPPLGSLFEPFAWFAAAAGIVSVVWGVVLLRRPR